MNAFSDFHLDAVLDGRKVSINNVLGKQLIVLGYAERNSRFAKSNDGTYIILQIEIDGERLVVFTAASIIRDQLNKYRDKLPFKATIVFNGKYYSFK